MASRIKIASHYVGQLEQIGEAWWIDEDIPIDRIKAVRFDLGKHKCGEIKEEEE